MNLIGVYKITSPTGKIYIGQSWNILNRLKSYSSLHYEAQPKIFNSIKKHGWENHTVEVLEIINEPSQHKLDDREIYWINHYRTHNFKMLNLRSGGSRGLHSPESKIKISKSLMGINHPMFGKKQTLEFIQKRTSKNIGKKRSLKTRKIQSDIRLGIRLTEQHKINLSQPIIQYSINNEFIREWTSIKLASNKLQINNISAVCRNLRKTAGGYIWKYKLFN